MLPAASLVSIATTWATSAGGTSRFCGLKAAISFLASSGVRFVLATIAFTACAAISVSANPGHTALAVTPLVANFAASPRVRPTRACFEAE